MSKAPTFTDVTEIPTRMQAFASRDLYRESCHRRENEDTGCCYSGEIGEKRETRRGIRLNSEIFARDFRCGIGAAVLRIAAFLSVPTKWRIGKHCDPQSVSRWRYNPRAK